MEKLRPYHVRHHMTTRDGTTEQWRMEVQGTCPDDAVEAARLHWLAAIQRNRPGEDALAIFENSFRLVGVARVVAKAHPELHDPDEDPEESVFVPPPYIDADERG